MAKLQTFCPLQNATYEYHLTDINTIAATLRNVVFDRGFGPLWIPPALAYNHVAPSREQWLLLSIEYLREDHFFLSLSLLPSLLPFHSIQGNASLGFFDYPGNRGSSFYRPETREMNDYDQEGALS